MKPFPSLTLSRAVALGGIALGFAISSGQAQTMLTMEHEPASPPKVKKISLLVELELPSDGDSVAADTVKADKYRLHASDRAHRGNLDAEQLRNKTVLPELPAETPQEPAQKFVRVTQNPTSSE